MAIARRTLLMRHGIAEGRAPSGRDEDRALCADGRRQVGDLARGLATLDLRIGEVRASPLLRAQQTAEIVARALGLGLSIDEGLSPGVDHAALARWLGGRDNASAVLLVGHQPDLGELLSYLLTGTLHSVDSHFAPATVACIAGVARPPTELATLEWLMHAEQLGRLR